MKFWQCHRDAKARIHILSDAVIKINEHAHPPSAIKNKEAKVKKYARHQTDEKCEPSSIVINKSIGNIFQAGIP